VSRLRKVTQLELEQFAEQIQEREELSGGKALSAQEVRERSMAARMALEAKASLSPTGTSPQTEEHGLGGKDGVPTWADCYHRLINAGFPWRMAAFVAWASMPKSLRWPDTQEKLATEVLGLTSDRQIATWRKKNPAIDQMIADLQADELLEARADVFAAVKDVASRHDYKSGPYARMYLEMTNDLPSRLSVTMQDSAAHSLLKMTDADLLNLSGEKAKEMLARLRAEQEEAADEPVEDE
jgi:hypothetical protein